MCVCALGNAVTLLNILSYTGHVPYGSHGSTRWWAHGDLSQTPESIQPGQHDLPTGKSDQKNLWNDDQPEAAGL